jgi:macrodomain Ter protein organizer (MatP/YcbG family)
MSAKDEKRVMITLNNDVFEKLERLSKETGLSKSSLITLWINEQKGIKKVATGMATNFN